ncbi:hypothetical protein CO058_00880 [candidate division WWE3 bacterium CG_4_9_14_0_2_um_filter_35_11]|uniref:YoaR-like putative peptidoglycan binding domain-containing protein n=1 Tax=candidate division WWE3 bacterium CG_4_9_14_0_2_um_filter_35_11 TaxID=1975077 RepID=A0A2M8EMJ0_UNCKA|nr:MAG: hypothetical protein COV25_00640 [candidate division WWE3 bacterium CG10_big_fil_rev_8_21_14_0_10_35_32]PJC23949.1 MAG: hypothetical protein CO058_00880 [candidate division WWE3 bacterium CG_4_9_14_0_2_um_filter_35_11]
MMVKTVIGNKRSKYKKPSRLWIGLSIVYFSLMIIFISYHVYFAKRIIPGVYVNDLYVGGMDIESAVKFLSDKNPYEKNDVSVVINGTDPVIIKPTDIDFEVLYVKTAKDAFGIGRSENFTKDFLSKLSFFNKKTKIKFLYDFSADQMQNMINSIVESKIETVIEPSFQISKSGELIIVDGQIGQVLDDNLQSKIAESMSGNDTALINISSTQVIPKFSKADLEFLEQSVIDITNVNYDLVFDSYSKKLTKTDLLSFIDTIKDSSGVSLSTNENNISKFLNGVAIDIDRGPRVQVLTVKEERALEFVAPQNGQKLKIEETVDAIKSAINTKTSKIGLVVEVTKPPENENSFGVKEIVGIGSSKFKGSITGRIKNIELAASRVNGVLVAPGEIFSFNDAVGEISSKTGYSTAYIISQGRTVLGDGGGVCQVSTTLFRAALDAGLPIVERNAHSYRVSYYEQDSAPGIDATIYSPSVDLRFKNDTPGYILITSEFSSKDSSLSFSIYGTKDGRVVDMTTPVVLSRTRPPATIYEEDSSLPVGVKKQVEHSVWGASVKFDRTVKSKDGEIMYQDTFKSNYRPWGAVYKIGV